jgi:hypothetical protein
MWDLSRRIILDGIITRCGFGVGFLYDHQDSDVFDRQPSSYVMKRASRSSSSHLPKFGLHRGSNAIERRNMGCIV